VRRRLAEPDPERRALDRLAWVHGTSGFGDALVAVALAGTLFFSVPVSAARPRVALYLLITVAPFAVVAPLLGRLLDGRSGASRVAMIVALGLRAVLAWLAATRIDGLLLFPLAFGLLVCSRVHGISRSALVPELVGAGRELVPINGRMARVAAIGGTLGGLLGVGAQKLLGGGGVLRLAAVVFLLGGALATQVPALRHGWHRRRGEPAAGSQGRGPAGAGAGPRVSLRRWPVARVRLARTASAATRAAGGFVLFLLAFALRSRGVSTAGLGLLVAGIGAGGLIGAFLVPRLGRRLREEGLLVLGLGLSAATSLLLAGRVNVVTAGLAGLIVGVAASAARLGFESLVQRDVPAEIRGTTITRSETAFQLSWVLGAVIPVALPLPAGPGLLAVGSACAFATGVYLFGRWRLRSSPGSTARPPTARRADEAPR
jgi:hypothetical protein